MSPPVDAVATPARSRAADIVFLLGGLTLQAVLTHLLRTRTETSFVRAVGLGYLLAGCWWGRFTAGRVLSGRGGMKRFVVGTGDFGAMHFAFQMVKAALLLIALMAVGAFSAPVEIVLCVRRIVAKP